MYHTSVFDCWAAYGFDCDRWFSRVLQPGDHVVDVVQNFSRDGRGGTFTVSVQGAVSGAGRLDIVCICGDVDEASILPYISTDSSNEVPGTAAVVRVAVDTER